MSTTNSVGEVLRGSNVAAGDLDLPAMVLKESALQHNVDLMRDYCERNGVALAPHGKTSMSPEVFARQIEAGAWAITAANLAQCRVMRGFGVRRILLANVLVDARGLEWAVEEIASGDGFAFLFYVDSDAGVEMAAEAVARSGHQVELDVLVELGYPGGRTGCRGLDDAVRLAERVHASRGLRLAGVSAFEGLMPGPNVDAVVDSCREYLAQVHDFAEILLERNLFDVAQPVVSAGGSSYFDLVTEALRPAAFSKPVTTVLRSGCYITHDHSMFHHTSPFGERVATGIDGRLEPAFELWATVWSRPEPRLAILGFGKRDAPYDYGLPVPIYAVRRGSKERVDIGADYQVTGLNDQHAFMTVPERTELDVGDVVVLGISHPCTAFDKWRHVPVVDDERTVVSLIHTYF